MTINLLNINIYHQSNTAVQTNKQMLLLISCKKPSSPASYSIHKPSNRGAHQQLLAGSTKKSNGHGFVRRIAS